MTMLAWFAQTALIAAVLATAAVLGGRLFRLGPAARHTLWLVVLVKLVAPPVVRCPWPAVVRRAATAAVVRPVSIEEEPQTEALTVAEDDSPEEAIAIERTGPAIAAA